MEGFAHKMGKEILPQSILMATGDGNCEEPVIMRRKHAIPKDSATRITPKHTCRGEIESLLAFVG